MRWLVALLLAVAWPVDAAEITSGFVARHWGGDVSTVVAAGGVGLEVATPVDDVRAAAGTYRNSFGRQTVYAGAAWRPLQLGPVAAGVLLGVATGYPRASLVPMVGLSANVAIGGPVRLHLVVMPPAGEWPAVLAGQIKVEF